MLRSGCVEGCHGSMRTHVVQGAKVASSAKEKEAEAGASSARTFREVILQEPIRQALVQFNPYFLHGLALHAISTWCCGNKKDFARLYGSQ